MHNFFMEDKGNSIKTMNLDCAEWYFICFLVMSLKDSSLI